MVIAILNGNPDPFDSGFEGYLHSIAKTCGAAGHTAELLTLRDMDIKRCLGCWSCWTKTPGRCAVRDDSETVCRSVVNADVALFASPVIMGFPSALTKRAMDKMIPLLLPYIELDRGECHHAGRYGKYPRFGLLLQRNGCDDDDIAIIAEIFGRAAINFKSRLAFAATTERPAEEVAHEACGF